jgi:hypothetical protein
VLARPGRKLLVERERRRRPRGVVRVVDPEDRDPVPDVDRVEVRQKAVLLAQWHDPRLGVREERAALLNGIAGLGHDHQTLVEPASTTTCAKEKIASFEPSVGMSSVRGSSATP